MALHAAVVISFVFAAIVNYVLSLIVVFQRGRHSLHKEVLLVYMLSAIGLLINVAVLSPLLEAETRGGRVEKKYRRKCFFSFFNKLFQPEVRVGETGLGAA